MGSVLFTPEWVMACRGQTAAADAVLFRSSFQGIEAAEAGQEAGFFT